MLRTLSVLRDDQLPMKLSDNTVEFTIMRVLGQSACLPEGVEGGAEHEEEEEKLATVASSLPSKRDAPIALLRDRQSRSPARSLR